MSEVSDIHAGVYNMFAGYLADDGMVIEIPILGSFMSSAIMMFTAFFPSFVI